MSLPLLLIHGANSAGRELAPLAEPLRAHTRVLTPDLPGHGGRELPEALSLPLYAEDLLRGLDAAGVERAVVGGYSIGGSAALHLTRHHPERVAGVLTLASKFIFDRRAVEHLSHLTDPDRVARPGNPRHAELLTLHQPQDWRAVILANQALIRALGAGAAPTEADLRAIHAPALVVSGTTDQVVPAAETVALGKLLPQGRTLLFPGYAHPLGAVPIAALVPHIARWLSELETGAR